MENNEKHSPDRRNFLKAAGMILGSGVAAGFLGAALVSCERDEIPPGLKPGETAEVDISQIPVLSTIGGVAKISVKGSRFIVKRNTAEEFLVFSAICPHQGCELDLPAQPNGGAPCPCHAVVFSLAKGESGKILSNPQGVSSGPLPALNSTFDAAKNILKIFLA